MLFMYQFMFNIFMYYILASLI